QLLRRQVIMMKVGQRLCELGYIGAIEAAAAEQEPYVVVEHIGRDAAPEKRQIRARAIVPIHAGAAEFHALSREAPGLLDVVFILRVELPGTRSLFPAQEAIGRHNAARRFAL